MGLSTLGISTTAETCMCGINVHKGAFVVGVIMLVLHALNCIAGLNELVNVRHNRPAEGGPTNELKSSISGPTTVLFSIILSVICGFLTALMIHGNRTRNRAFIRPYLVVEFVLSWFILCGAVLLAIAGFLTLVASSEYPSVSLAWIILAGIFGLIGILRLYFCVVVPKRSYNLIPSDENLV